MTNTLTTPLYYVNDKPHIGSVYTTLAVDTLARFERLKGEEVIFITGCDEHGQKIQRTAANQGVEPKQHCDLISSQFESNWKDWGISNDRFIRTTDPRHRSIVEQFFKRVEANGDIIQGRQQGWYCVACEEYKDDPADAVDPFCPIHNRALEWRDESNLFFRLSRYQKPIEELISRDGFIRPLSRRHEVQRFVEGGLRDFSISRLDLPWGIPVPGHEGHTFYVWFDALLGYITALLDPDDEPDLQTAISRGWPSSLHVIGKDILRFHAVYWPAMCLSAGIEPPKAVFGHGFLTREGQKMGKSLGNTIDPSRLLEHCGADAVRWYLLRDIQFGDDGDIQQQRLLDLVNNDLANTIGNLVNRTVAMSRKWFDGIPAPSSAPNNQHPLAIAAEAAIHQAPSHYQALAFHLAAQDVLQLAIDANGYLSEKAPWSAIKDPNNRDAVAADLYAVLETARLVGVLLAPLLPDLSQRLLTQLDQPPLDWNRDGRWGRLNAGQSLPEPVPLLQRLELEEPL
ncbi:MAG: methionine--tRNA ligase [Synechococcus sp. TMED19]|nr:MAG: methionine--tRNA ligase [Synechococcus sp. TMED19]